MLRSTMRTKLHNSTRTQQVTGITVERGEEALVQRIKQGSKNIFLKLDVFYLCDNLEHYNRFTPIIFAFAKIE